MPTARGLPQTLDITNAVAPSLPSSQASFTPAAFQAAPAVFSREPLAQVLSCFSPPCHSEARYRGVLGKRPGPHTLPGQAAEGSGKKLMYAENWVYAPGIQKECEILRKTQAQILWILAEESHSGSHSPSYGIWAQAGGGSIVGKSCHPMTAALTFQRTLVSFIKSRN